MNKDGLYKAVERTYLKKKEEIESKIEEFHLIGAEGTNEDIFLELVFCILAAGTSANLALKVSNILRKDNFIFYANLKEIIKKLKTCYRFYNIRGRYIFQTREYIRSVHKFNFKKIFEINYTSDDRRSFFSDNKNIIGVGMKAASHFLRNVGFMEYAILDKHIISIMKEFNLIHYDSLILSKNNYIKCELILGLFAKELNMPLGKLDLILWYMKTGEIIK